MVGDLFSQHAPSDYIEQDGVRYWREDLVTVKKKRDASGFDVFWMNVPGDKEFGTGRGFKIGRSKSEGEFKKLTPEDRRIATAAVGPFYAHWRKAHPDAAKLHPERFLKNRRWEDEGWESKATSEAPSKQKLMEMDAQTIKSGKRFLCTHISAVKARTLIDAGMVSYNECRDVGINL